jgi:GTPase SAR1 family protein
MKKIIALRGKGNSGKTTTIRKLYKRFIDEEFEIIKTNFKEKGGDFIAIFKINGKLVGMTSSGDTYDLVSDSLQEQVDGNCELCICACRTFDRIEKGTNKAIYEFEDYENEFLEKTVDANTETRNETNQIDAEKLFNRICLFLN